MASCHFYFEYLNVLTVCWGDIGQPLSEGVVLDGGGSKAPSRAESLGNPGSNPDPNSGREGGHARNPCPLTQATSLRKHPRMAESLVRSFSVEIEASLSLRVIEVVSL